MYYYTTPGPAWDAALRMLRVDLQLISDKDMHHFVDYHIKSNIKFLADDTILFSIVNDHVTSANDLNHDFEMICQWAHQLKMEFNPDPTKQATEVLFSCKENRSNHPQLTFNGSTVVTVTEQKHLGLTLAPGLSFEKHLSEKIIKAKKNIGILKHLSKFLPLRTLDQMYKALVRSHLDYCDVIYHVPSITHPPPLGRTLSSQMMKVERIQYQAALAITGAWQGSSRSKICDELGWESLSDRRKYRSVLHVHKIINNNTISYLNDKLTPHCREMFSGNTRTTFNAIRCKSNRCMSSFVPDAIASCNLLMEIFNHKDVPSMSSLKKDILSLMRPESKRFFKIHDPSGLRHLFQLRLRLSPLKSHKYRYNFIDTPSGTGHCGEDTEDTSHFLFSCPLYTVQRVALMTSVYEILLKVNLIHLGNQSNLYLYGDPSINNVDINKILLSTIKYIKETQHFSA